MDISKIATINGILSFCLSLSTCLHENVIPVLYRFASFLFPDRRQISASTEITMGILVLFCFVFHKL